MATRSAVERGARTLHRLIHRLRGSGVDEQASAGFHVWTTPVFSTIHAYSNAAFIPFLVASVPSAVPGAHFGLEQVRVIRLPVSKGCNRFRGFNGEDSGVVDGRDREEVASSGRCNTCLSIWRSCCHIVV